MTNASSGRTGSLEAREEPITDGRRQRRERGRAAVIEALIDLLFEGDIAPTAGQIVARAEVSTMSLYRYFDGLDDLRNAAVDVWFSRFPNLLTIDRIGVGDVSDRIVRLVDARLQLYETAEPFGHLFRFRSYEHERAREMLAFLHAGYTSEIAQHFEPELNQRSGDDATRLVALIATLTSFEAWGQLLTFHEFDHDQVHRLWTAALAALINAT